ncbi:DUF726-domain-containing protein [Pleomassaria siparia CBS 279.74]|uniref:DUF726-domain-containing protein n=1 Tax=Pleomassaria siparia CBS 279.74 TaxID=1314801 RepID=A0A6G1JU59_9PLEO|nr:DUF726-domain-containing protein [Pleomassaria siparia CBS 279.74]
MLFKMANVITGAGPEAAKADEGASLTSVLETPALRIELALLVLLCTDAMRSDYIATFDPNKTHETTSTAPTPKPKSQSLPVHDLISFDAPQDKEAMAAERARHSRQLEIESTQMQGLRRSGLTFFDKWRASVMHRICDVLCVRGEVVRQAKMKRKQMLDEGERQRQGNSLLIEFGGDPFGGSTSVTSGPRKHGHYNILVNKLQGFEERKKVLILNCLLLLLLSLEHYPAHSRVLLLHITSSLELEVDMLAEHEKTVAQGLLASAAAQMDAEASTRKQASNDATSRRWKVGLAAVGGAVLIGVTGGLAAPLLAAGLGTVFGGLGLGIVGTYLGALAGSSVLVGSLFGAYGGKMTGRIMRQYAQEVQDFEFIPIQDPDRPSAQRSQEWAEEQDALDPAKREQHRLRVSIGVSGWLNSPSDVNTPWEVIEASGTEPFALRFELDSMLRLGNSLNDVLYSYAWDGITYTIVSRTVLGALYAGLWPLGLVKAASVLDNPFSVALARADKAGKVLAQALIDGVQGKRPVTLMGYSVGARVIYACLIELAKQNAFGLVESAVLMGAPVPSDSQTWRQIRSVVAARVVNVYSTEDYILGFLYRSTKLQMGVAGLQEVKDVFGIENADMSKLINGHDKYRYLVGTILTKIGIEGISFNKVAEQERALELAEQKKEQVRKQVHRQKKDTRRPHSSAPGPSEMIVVRDQKVGNLVDLSAPTPELSMSYPTQRPMMQQQRSGQQPAIQRHMGMARTTKEASTALAIPSSFMDPLSGSIPLGQNPTPSPPAQTFPIVSRAHQLQLPSNMVPTPPGPTQLVYHSGDEDDHQIKMVEIDDQKFSPPLEEMLRSPKSTPGPARGPEPINTNIDVVATTVDIAKDVDSGDYEDMDREFDELSMIDPVPLDDDDFGLM